jgi:hypothetical protein
MLPSGLSIIGSFFVQTGDPPIFFLLFGLSTIPVENSVENGFCKHRRPHHYATLARLHNY